MDDTIAALFAASAEDRLEFSLREDGSAIVRNVKVFRSGQFKDSLGRRGKWTPEHLASIVSNFSKLRDRLPNVPVRVGHTRNPRDVFGYFEAMRTDGKFLYCDFAVTEPAELDRLKRGTYRSRSFEVGMYEDNDGNRHWPVALGLAYVDIPAVEGLYSSQIGEQSFTIVTPESDNMDGLPVIDQQWAAAFYAQGLADAPQPTTHTFTIGGAQVTDPVAVQSHITALETFQSETIAASRKAFVTGLAQSNKIMATQVDQFEKHVASLTSEQFDAFKALYEGVPGNPTLANHGSGGSEGNQIDPVKVEIATLEEVVAMHRKSGLSEAEIQGTQSFQRLAVLTATK